MKTPFLCALGLAALLFPSGGGAGTVEGTITLPAPEPESHGASLYGKYKTQSTEHAMEPAKGQGVLCLMPRNPAPFVSRPIPVMDQIGKRFVPRVIPVQVGGQVRFLNSDKLFHNVFSLSPAKKFDLGRNPQGHARTLTFAQAGIVQVFCDIHPHMVGFVVVVESPYYAVLGADGAYRIPEVPAGDYTVQAWSEGMPRLTAVGEVTVSSAGATQFDARLVN